MLKRSKKLKIIFLASIVILSTLYIIFFLINFFKEDNTIKETIVGANPISEKESIMTYQEPLTVILENPEVTENTIPEESAEDENSLIVGTIQIPKTGVDTSILSRVTVEGMTHAPCLLYSTGKLNQNGNTLIVGHNYRNGTIFSDNKNLNLGDKIYVTTLDGNRVEYTIYNKFVTTAEDVSYIKRDTGNKPEITLSCCTDDDEYRIIILAKI